MKPETGVIPVKIFLFTLFVIFIGCNTNDDLDNPIVEDKIYSGNKVIKSQEELNAFGSLKYTSINGSLTIKNTNDLSSLSTIKEIVGNLTIGYVETFDEWRE